MSSLSAARCRSVRADLTHLGLRPSVGLVLARRCRSRLSASDDFAAPPLLPQRAWLCASSLAVCRSSVRIYVDSPQRTCHLLEQSWLVAVAVACLLVTTSPHPSPASECVAACVITFRRPQLQRARGFDSPRPAAILWNSLGSSMPQAHVSCMRIFVDSPRRTWHLLEQSWLVAAAVACLLVTTSSHPSPASESVAIRVVYTRRVLLLPAVASCAWF